VEWVLGDGISLKQADDSSASGILSFVVFHHIPDPEVTMGYVREMGRVLEPGGWSAFHVSNDPKPHQKLSVSQRVRNLLRGVGRRGPKGANHQSWLGSYVDLARLRAVAAESGLEVERAEGEGTFFCFVLLRRNV